MTEKNNTELGKKVISFFFIVLLFLPNPLVTAHHDSVPQGQHVMPNGQVMNNQDMMNGNVVDSLQGPSSSMLWFVFGFMGLIGLIIWFLSKNTKNKK